MKITELTLKQAKAQGYRVISRRHRMAARIDREDWREFLIKQYHDNDFWRNDPGAEDHYRRIFSKDVIIVPQSWIGKLPTSQ